MGSRFAIFLTDEGAKHVDTEIDLDILGELVHGDKTIGEIADNINKSRTTVSGRLSRLEKEHIVGSVGNDDMRKRVHTLTSDRVVEPRKISPSSHSFFINKAKMIVDRDIDLYEGLVECMFYGAAISGLNTCPLFTYVAERIGKKVADGCGTNDFFKLSEKLNELFRSNGIGEFKMTVTYYVRIVFSVAEKNQNSELHLMNYIYSTVIKAALERNSGRKMKMSYEPLSNPSDFELRLSFVDA